MEENNKSNIKENSNILFEKESTFNKIKNLQINLKKEHFLKVKCKYFIKYIYIII